MGIGTKLNEFFGKYYVDQGYKYFIRTTHTRLKRHLAKNPNWRATATNEKQLVASSTSKLQYDTKRIAASYEYLGTNYATKPPHKIVVDDNDQHPTIDELKQLKDKYWLTVITGRHKVENETEKNCRQLGIRTQLLYITQKGITRRVAEAEKYETRVAPEPIKSETKQVKTDPKPRSKPTRSVVVEPKQLSLFDMPDIPLAPDRKKDKASVPREKRRILWTDIETYSGEELKTSGLHKYVEHKDFGILLLAYAWDDDPVSVIDMTDPFDVEIELPAVLAGLQDPDVLKISHNCAFERASYHRQFGAYQPPEEWEDTMILAAMNGLPMSLDAAGAALALQNQKLKEGVALINYFCRPCTPTLTNGGRTRNLPKHAPDKWERFKQYAARDVETMRDIYKRVKSFVIPEWERQLNVLDTQINERGIMIDIDLAEAALHVDDTFRTLHQTELQKLTGLDNPNSVTQLKTWLENVGIYCDSLNKGTVNELRQTVRDPKTRRVLELRQLLGKTSTKKYNTMIAAANNDHRVRGTMQYYGAGRTGRWAGRLLQVQNLPQNHLDQIDLVRELVRDRDLDTLEMLFDNVPDVLSQLIRTALIAKPGHTFVVCDYSAIEARVIAYLAGEQWRMDVFAQGGDIYCSSASQMFKVPVEKHGVNGHLRAKGKIAELACGYGGGVGALKAFGADKMGLTEDEMADIVTQWRQASPTIPKFWRDTEKAARSAIQMPGRTFSLPCGVEYFRDADALRCKLPSGRILSYWGARIDDGGIVFMGQNQTTRKWEKTDTWGGKLVENIVQAFARDCLAIAMLRLDAAGYAISFHVHDEVIVEAPDSSHLVDVAEIMSQPIDWAPGLLLKGEGYTTPFYMKD